MLNVFGILHLQKKIMFGEGGGVKGREYEYKIKVEFKQKSIIGVIVNYNYYIVIRNIYFQEI